jgi:hypothetical protein
VIPVAGKAVVAGAADGGAKLRHVAPQVDALPADSASLTRWGAAILATRFWSGTAGFLLLASGAAMAIDEPRYTVVRTEPAFEVRRYEPYLVAETLVAGSADEAGSQGFRVLAGYIFGKNTGAREIAMTAPVAQTPATIAMTAPVAQSPGAGGHVVQFAMPPEWTLDTLPEPTNPAVSLRALPARTVAVIRYSGTWSQERYAQHLAKLQDALMRTGLRWNGEPVWARYDPPWKPWFLRRNEIWLELD